MEDFNNLGAIRFFFANSQQNYLVYCACSALKQLVVKHWHDIDGAEILSLKDSLYSFILDKAVVNQVDQ